MSKYFKIPNRHNLICSNFLLFIFFSNYGDKFLLQKEWLLIKAVTSQGHKNMEVRKFEDPKIETSTD